MFPVSKVPRYYFQSHWRLAQFRQTNSIPHTLPFTITYKTPTDTVPVTTSFETLEDFQSYFCGWLFKNPVTNRATLPARMDSSHADSTVVYLAEHPRYIGVKQLGVPDRQISDKVFEEKAIKAIEGHLSPRGDIRRFVAKDSTRQDSWRYITGETDIVEWDGIWQGPDEHVYFLQTTYFVDVNIVFRVGAKLEKSLKHLGTSARMATVYVAGEYWSTECDVVDYAQKRGCGMVKENGTDLEVKDPIRGLEIGHNNDGQVVVEAKKRGRKPKVKK